MRRPTVTVQQPAFLVHLGHIETWTDYGNGFGDDREVNQVRPNSAGNRPCRWIREGDMVCIDLDKVTCELCLKSRQAQKERAQSAPSQIKPSRPAATAEGRLFWRRLDEDVKRWHLTTTPQQRFELYCQAEMGRRIARVAKVDNLGTSSVKVVLV